jgi:hypothetical protein
MLETLIELLPEILKATGETLLMLAICLSAAMVRAARSGAGLPHQPGQSLGASGPSTWRPTG